MKNVNGAKSRSYDVAIFKLNKKVLKIVKNTKK